MDPESVSEWLDVYHDEIGAICLKLKCTPLEAVYLILAFEEIYEDEDEPEEGKKPWE